MLLLRVFLDVLDGLQGLVVRFNFHLTDFLHVGHCALHRLLLLILGLFVEGFRDVVASLLPLGLMHFFHVALEAFGGFSLLGGDGDL